MADPIDVVVDLSHHNAAVDFPVARRAGLLGIIHKATQGVTFLDKRYESRRGMALGANLLWGAYHFGTGDASGTEQADYFLSKIDANPQTLLALDSERNTTPPKIDMTLSQASDFVTRVHDRAGRWPLFYVSPGWLRNAAGDRSALAKCPLWLTEWGPTAHVPQPWQSWTFWQYANKGNVEGIGVCDRDRFAGDTAALTAFWTGAAAE